LARGREGQNRAQAENVAGRSHIVAFCLFRRHESGRADHHPRLRQRARFRGKGDAEIEHSWPVIRDDHVRGFQIAMDHTCGVDRAQALG
jgi:hypothetical protein